MNSIHTVAVVGAGTMGAGILQVCARAGFTTILFDVNPTQLRAAVQAISENLALAVEKGRASAQQRTEILSRITLAFQLTEVKADLIIEAAVENLEIKQKLFLDLEKINAGRAILATNTSSISVDKIAGVLNDPSRCIGLHFFNPADRMKLVEIISGTRTDPQMVMILKDFSGRIEKTAVLAKDSPGFIVNRVARHYYVESLKLLEENTASAPAMDDLMRATGFKMGPFELMDLIGLDVNLAVTQSVYEGFNRNPKFKPSRTQQDLVSRGEKGRKTGKGFYDYSRK